MPDLGDRVRDVVTGYTGVVLAKMEALFEASQCRVHPDDLDDSGDPREPRWIENDRLVVTKEHAVKLSLNSYARCSS